MLDEILKAGLTPTVRTDYERWKPLHWSIAVPDVMERGGFDAVIGNPPFRGGTYLTSDMGTNFRDWLVNVVAQGRRGQADLVGYFICRAYSLIKDHGCLGLIATNSAAQGKTREISLDFMVDSGFTITRSIQSRPWPTSTVTLQYAAIWGTRGTVASDILRYADGVKATRISSLLEPEGRIKHTPTRLKENIRLSFEGCKPYGTGFTITQEEARSWIAEDPDNRKVLFPYLGGSDVNTRPDVSPSHWIIDFYRLSEDEAKEYVQPYRRVLELVKPERMTNKRRARRERWWQFAENAVGMREATKELDQVIVLTRVSKTLSPVRVAADSIFSDRLTVFASNSYELQAILSSSIHVVWAMFRGTTRTGDPSYAPTAVFETFPQPQSVVGLAEKGERFEIVRHEIMSRRGVGLTDLYDLVNDPFYTDDDITRMREIHVGLDQAVMDAYGWGSVPLDHGFHTYRQMQRWTVSPAARVEILDRLLAENLRRAAAQGEAPPPAEDEDEGDDE
jgi:hypothetical protein